MTDLACMRSNWRASIRPNQVISISSKPFACPSQSGFFPVPNDSLVSRYADQQKAVGVNLALRNVNDFHAIPLPRPSRVGRWDPPTPDPLCRSRLSHLRAENQTVRTRCPFDAFAQGIGLLEVYYRNNPDHGIGLILADLRKSIPASVVPNGGCFLER